VLARTRQPELMDDPALDAAAHRHALNGLARLNSASFAAESIWRELRRRVPTADRISLLDVATGSGDIPLALRRLARRDGVELELTLCDVSRGALDQASARAKSMGVTIRTVEIDALADDLPTGFEAATCSLFLHHLDADDVCTLLAKLARSADHVVISDLCRSRRGIALAAVASRAMTRSRVVHTDAVLSARAAWTPGEMLRHAERAGIVGVVGVVGVRTRRVFPCRFMLSWSSA